MPTVTVLYGHAYDGKNQETFRKCLEKIRHNEGASCVYLVRSDVRVRQLRDVVLQELSGCFHFPVSTLPDFIKNLYRECSGTRRVISGLEQKLLIEDILRQSEQERGRHFHFYRFRDYPGILAKVNEFITRVRRIGISSHHELAEKLRKCSARRQRQIHEELVQLFERYGKRLDAANVIDETGIFLDVARRAAADQLDIRSWVPSPELLVLEGYYELTLPEQQILNVLCAQFERSILTLDTPLNPYTFPAETEIPKPFRIFEDIVLYIQRAGFSLRETEPSYAHSKPIARSSLAEALFGMNTPETDVQGSKETIQQKTSELFQESESLSVKSYRDKKEEVTEIAREIRTLYREGKITALRDVGVTFPVIEQYERLVREIFPLFGIPFTMFQGYSLKSSPVVVTIFRLLRVVLDGYSREAMAKLFSSPLVQFEMPNEDRVTKRDEFCTPLALNSDTYHYLDSLARSLKIVAGREEWIEKLTQYNTEHEQQKAEDETQDAETKRPPADRLLPTIHCLLHFLSCFETKTPRPFEELMSLLIEGIQRFQIPQRILCSEHRPILENDASALQAFLRILDTLKQELTTSHHKGTPSYALTLEKFFDLLRITVQGETYYPSETLKDSVFVTGRLDTRQVRFTYLFFGGLVERDFPGQEEPNIFLSDQDSEALGLPTYKKRFQETDFLFYVNFLNPTEKLYLSYPLQEGETDLLRSAYIDKLIHMQDSASPTSPNESGTSFLPDADQDSLTQEGQDGFAKHNLENIFTYAELYQWLGTRFTQKNTPTHGEPTPSPSQEGNNTLHSRGETPPLIPPRRGVTLQPPSKEEEDVLRFIETEKGREFVENFLDGLQAQGLRISDEFGRFEGILASNWSRRLLRRRYSNHIYSVSEFDQFVQCPIKFFFQRITHLEPLQEVATEIPAVAIGTLLHKILYRFYADASPKVQDSDTGNVDNGFLQRRTEKEEWIREAGIRMDTIVREELQSQDFSGVFWERFADLLVTGLLQDGAREMPLTFHKKQGLLATFIDLEVNNPDKVIPCYLDAHFGMLVFPERGDRQNEFDTPGETGYILSREPFRVREKDADGRMAIVNIRGEIDRIDLEPVKKEKCRVVIYDYKTGTIPSVQKIKDGLSFQLPLYLLAVQEFLGKEYEVVAGGYYQLKSPRDIGKKGYLGSKEYSEQRYFKGYTKSLFDTHAEFLRMLEEYKTRVVRVVQAIKEGRFHPTILEPQEAGCNYCEYNQICRVDHQRMRNLN